MTHAHSRIAYRSIDTIRGPACRKVYRAIMDNAPATRQDVAEILGWPINCVTGRVRELLDSNYIEERGSVRVGARPRALLGPNYG